MILCEDAEFLAFAFTKIQIVFVTKSLSAGTFQSSFPPIKITGSKDGSIDLSIACVVVGAREI